MFPAFELVTNPSPDVGEDDPGSNNIRLESVRFLDNPYFSCLLSSGVRVIFFAGCYWQGLTTTTTANIVLNSVKVVSLTGCHLRGAGSYHINANDSEGLIVTPRAGQSAPPTLETPNIGPNRGTFNLLCRAASVYTG